MVEGMRGRFFRVLHIPQGFGMMNDMEALYAAQTVLIIEDSPVQSKIIRNQIMALSQFDTLAAYTLEEARALLTTHKERIFVAVIDLNLPDAPNGEGVDLCLDFGVPTVVLTATFNEDIRRRFIERNVADFFFKGTIQDMDPMVRSLERLFKNQFVKALVVEDSRMSRAHLRHLLEVQRFQVLEAADGLEAVDRLAENPDIGLIITDYNMPNMDGFELVKTVRARYKVDRIAIVGVSAAGSGSLTAQFLKNGANDFLTKPFEVEEFYWRVNQTVSVLEVMKDLRTCQDTLPEG
jgi:PleD family two-component response regulator